MAKHPQVLNHVGLLFNEPPGRAGLPFIKSSENLDRSRRMVRRGSTHWRIVHHRLAKGSQIPGKQVGFVCPMLDILPCTLPGSEGFALGPVNVSPVPSSDRYAGQVEGHNENTGRNRGCHMRGPQAL